MVSLWFVVMAGIGLVAMFVGKYLVERDGQHRGPGRSIRGALALRNVGVVLFLVNIMIGAVIIAVRTP